MHGVPRPMRIAVMLSLLLPVHLCAAATGQVGEQGPIPFNKLTTDAHNTLIVDTLGKMPLGRIPVAGYKLFDYARLVGEAAVEKEDEALRAEVVLMNADAARLKRLVAAGEGNGEAAAEVKRRLRAHGDRLDSGDPGAHQHLFNVTTEHFGYAVRRASVQWGMKQAFKRVLKSTHFLRFWRQAMPLGRESASLIGNRSALRPWMQALGWRSFGKRAAAMERYVDRVTDAYLDALIAETVRKDIADTASGTLERLYGQILADRPSKPVVRQRVRHAIATQPELYVPMSAVAALVPLPVAAAPAPVAIVAAPRAADPVALAILNEDRHLQSQDWVVDVSGDDGYHAPAPAEDVASPPTPEPEPAPRQRTVREQELHDELMCVGAGNKPGCERWNISSNPQVEGNWDGRRGGTLRDR